MASKKRLAIIIGCALLIVVLGIYVFTRPEKKQETVITQIEAAEVIPYLSDGDIILRLGDGPLSGPFRNTSATDKRFSHLGIVHIRDGAISIINSVGSLKNREKGVDEETLEDFLSFAKSVGVFRTKSVNGAALSDKAREYIGCPFDWGFDLTDESKIYCTELLYVVLKYVAPEITLSTNTKDTRDKEFIPLDAVSNSADFDEILYIELK